MQVDEFRAVTKQAANRIFGDVLPRVFKKYATDESLPACMLNDLDNGRVYEIVQEIRMGKGGFISRWRDKHYISLASTIRKEVPVVVKQKDRITSPMIVTNSGLDYHESAQALASSLMMERQEKAYQELKRTSGIGRLAAFRYESVDKVYEFAIENRHERLIEVYYPCWCGLDNAVGGLLFGNAGGLEHSIGLILFHELIHCMESVPGFPTPLSNNELANYKNVLGQIFRNIGYTGGEEKREI